MVHGGWVLTLIDSATGCAAHSMLPAGFGIATIETKANFTRPIYKDTRRVRTETRVVVRGRQIVTAEARVLDSDGRVLAHGTSTVMVVANKSDGGSTANLACGRLAPAAFTEPDRTGASRPPARVRRCKR
jgi:uncharacterized protein (TIGR00369 family)